MISLEFLDSLQQAPHPNASCYDPSPQKPRLTWSQDRLRRLQHTPMISRRIAAEKIRKEKKHQKTKKIRHKATKHQKKPQSFFGNSTVTKKPDSVTRLVGSPCLDPKLRAKILSTWKTDGLTEDQQSVTRSVIIYIIRSEQSAWQCLTMLGMPLPLAMLAMFAQHCNMVVCSVWSCSLLASLACTDLRMPQARLGFRVGCCCKVFGCLGLWMIKELFDLFATKKHKKEKSKAKRAKSIIKSERWWNKVVLSSLCFPATCSKMYKKRMFKTLLLAFSRLSSVLRSRIASLNPRKTNYHEPNLKVLAAQCQTMSNYHLAERGQIETASLKDLRCFHELAREDFACSRPSTEKVSLEGDYPEIWFFVRLWLCHIV